MHHPPPPGYAIRRAEPADSRTLAAVRRAMREEALGRLDPNDAVDARARSFFEEHLVTGRVRMWIAEAEHPGGPAEAVATGGYSVLAHPPKPEEDAVRRAFVHTVWTHPGHRGKGVARAVMSEALADAKAIGVKRVELRTTADARAMYLKMGFMPIEVLRVEL